jgi:hypothetical protein
MFLLAGVAGVSFVGAQDNAATVDPSKVKFLVACRGRNSFVPQASGVVAREIDLSQSDTATQLLQMGATLAFEKCASSDPFDHVTVHLRHGDPANFTNFDDGFEWANGSYYGYPADAVTAWVNKKGDPPSAWTGYTNRPKELKDQQIAEAAKARQRAAALEQQRQAEQKTAARWAAFLKTNGVKHVVTIDQLTANPFAYQGQVVAIRGAFKRMNTATQGIFEGYSARGGDFVVSRISAARFTRTGISIWLAGRVLGNIEVKPGPMVVPHLSFVGLWVPD